MIHNIVVKWYTIERSSVRNSKQKQTKNRLTARAMLESSSIISYCIHTIFNPFS